MIYFWKHLLFTIDVQSRKPVTLALSSLWPKEWPKNGQKMATLSLSISKYVSKKFLLFFLAFAFRYIRSGELFVQQPVLHNEGRLSCSVNKYIPRCTYPFYKVFDLTQQYLLYIPIIRREEVN